MKTIDAFDRQFPTEESCRQFLVDMRWPKGVRCPRCDNSKVYALKARPFHWVCKAKDCGGKNGYRFSVITYTIFQDTKIGLKIWFKIGYLMLVGKKGEGYNCGQVRGTAQMTFARSIDPIVPVAA